MWKAGNRWEATVIDTEGLTKLLTIQAPDPGIVSVYLTVPLDPAQRRGMQARLDDVLGQVDISSGDGDSWARAQRSEVPVVVTDVAARRRFPPPGPPA